MAFNRFLNGFLWIVLLSVASPNRSPAESLPNFIIINCDDLGYGDLACFGHPAIATPHLDRMASEGMKLTQFYSAAPVCTPSRAALMTGRLPARSGMCSNKRRVLFPNSKGGLPANEITLAEALKSKDYATACIGKWHLGHLPAYLPTNHGFDDYFGIPYSNDMDRVAAAPKGRQAFWEPSINFWHVPLMRQMNIIERPADQTTITRRYTEEAIKFIQSHQENPFFLYLAHSMPHIPLFRSAAFVGRSRSGIYGDVVEEIDWSVGRIMETLQSSDLAKNTLVIFTSDNGPWLIFDDHGGSAGLLRDGKGSTWEGGMREPTIAWWPGEIAPGSVGRDIASSMDLFATFHALAKIDLPTDRTLDSHDLTPMLHGQGASSRNTLFYYRGYKLMAVRMGPWKAHFITQDAYGPGSRKPIEHNPPLLFNLEVNPSERDAQNLAAQKPDLLARIQKIVAQHQANLQVATSQLENENL